MFQAQEKDRRDHLCSEITPGSQTLTSWAEVAPLCWVTLQTRTSGPTKTLELVIVSTGPGRTLGAPDLMALEILDPIR